MYLTVAEYAKKHNITRAGVHNRISSGNISSDRISKNDGGKIIIKERDLNG
jgi:hypothetical protein